jgi:hypothetical protein
MRRCHLLRRLVSGALGLAATILLCGAGLPAELMPREGRTPLFGNEAFLRLTPAEDNDSRTFGRRPPLDRGGAFGWRVRWAGDGYDVYDWPEEPFSSRNGRMVLRPMSGSQHLYVMQFTSDDPDEGGAVYEYALLWRLSKREYVGYLRLLGSECSAVAPATLAALGFTPADIATCTPRSWAQVEGLLRAYAATRPPALGTLRWLRKPDRPR